GEDVPQAEQPLTLELPPRIRPVRPTHAVTPGVDAFFWRTRNGKVTIAGTNPRSVLFGVYDLLEEFGCRFYGASPDDEVVPRLADRPFAHEAERFEQATFPFR